jgi:hypothetical protein
VATPSSSAPRAKAALWALLAADSALSAAKRDWGPVPRDRLQHDHVWFGRPSDGRSVEATQEPRIGNQRRDEDYTLFVTITVARGGYDFEAMDDAAFALMAALEVALRADPTLHAYDGGQPIGQPFQCTVGGYEQSNFPALEGGGASQIVISIDCSATLRAT